MALGRPLSPLTLVPAERQQLLEWTRRPKTAQALALRAPSCCSARRATVIRKWLGGGTSRWRRWASGDSVFSISASMDCSMSPGPAPASPQRFRGGTCAGTQAGNPAGSGDPLVHPLPGPGHRTQPEQHQPHLAHLLVATASQPSLQAEPRSAVYRQSARPRGLVSEPARPRPGAVRGREESDSGAGPHRAAVAHAPRTDRAATTTNATAPPACLRLCSSV